MAGATSWSVTKVGVSESPLGIADKYVQVMGSTGVTRDTAGEQVFRGVRAFRIYNCATEVRLWLIAKRIPEETINRLRPRPGIGPDRLHGSVP
jgi:acyl-CoA dehydrogenase